MFLILLDRSLTFGVALLATVIYTEGALLALRTAARVIGWLFVFATLGGFVGLRRESFGRFSAATATLCSGVACQESVRLEYCETELGDERTCPSPIPASHPG